MILEEVFGEKSVSYMMGNMAYIHIYIEWEREKLRLMENERNENVMLRER